MQTGNCLKALHPYCMQQITFFLHLTDSTSQVVSERHHVLFIKNYEKEVVFSNFTHKPTVTMLLLGIIQHCKIEALSKT